VAFDADGTLYFLFVGLAGPGNAPVNAFLATSSDRGASFNPPRQVLGPNSFMGAHGHRPQRRLEGVPAPGVVGAKLRAVPRGVPERPQPHHGRLLRRRRHHVLHPAQVSDPQRQRVVAPALTIEAGGAVHVAYYDLQDDAVDYQGLEGPDLGRPLVGGGGQLP
jgi:hypothetical protein